MSSSTVLSAEQLLKAALKIADAAKSTPLKYFRNNLDIEYKDDQSPVTRGDQETERLMRDMINADFPGHGIYGEEYGQENIDSDYVWILDPIDGTKSFITGNPMFGMLCGILHMNKPVLGMVQMPALNELFIGTRGQPSLWYRPTQESGEIIKTSNCTNLKEATLLIGEGDKMLGQYENLVKSLMGKVRLPRFGYDCYQYGQLAAGTVDLVLEAGLQPYDYLPLIPLIEGAGGVITNWDGGALDLNSEGHVLASANQNIHDQMLEILATDA